MIYKILVIEDDPVDLKLADLVRREPAALSQQAGFQEELHREVGQVIDDGASRPRDSLRVLPQLGAQRLR